MKGNGDYSSNRRFLRPSTKLEVVRFHSAFVIAKYLTEADGAKSAAKSLPG